MVKKALAVALAAALSGLGSAVASEVEIPVEPVNFSVPANVMSDNVPRATGSFGGSSATRNVVNESPQLTMAPGINEIVPVAIGHLNRIVTPFGEPQVTTTSDATTEIRDNVVYVATDQQAPVTMFITQKGSEAKALSLTLVPRRIPPRELFIELEGMAFKQGLVSSPRAERWETSQPYIDTLKSLMRSIALGEIPQGYTLYDMDPRTVLPSCSQPGVTYDFVNGQTMTGHKLSVSIGVARNVSGQPLEIKEQACGNWNVAAVAAWPRNVLGPNQKTELYVVTKIGERPEPTSQRPSLLGGAQ